MAEPQKMKTIIKKINPGIIKIMKLIAEHGFITNQEIKMFLNVKQVCSVYRYVGFLKYIEVVDEIKIPYYGMKVFCLNRQGYDLLGEFNELRVLNRFYKSDFDLAYFNHIRTNLQVRCVFESHPWVVDYRPERVIDYYAERDGELADKYKRGMKHMDAEVILKLPRGETKAGIEIELVRKSYQTYKRNLLNLNNRRDLDFVYWICGNDEILRTILEVLKDNRSDLWDPERHCLTTWDRFKQVKFDDYIWTNVNNEAVAILPPLTSPEVQATKLELAPEPKLTEPEPPPPPPKEPEPEPKPGEPKIEPDQKPKFRPYRPFIPPEPEPKQPRLR